MMNWNEHLSEYLKANFNPGKVSEAAIKWVREWFEKNGPDSYAVIGISGGKDSTTVAYLCTQALGRDRVFGVLMPDHEQSDIEVSKAVVDFLGIDHAIVNVGKTTDAVKAGISCAEIFSKSKREITKTPQMMTNIAPRVRMTTLYAISQTMNGRVSNNCNASENFVGYSTVFGDAAGDFSLLRKLTVAEIITMGEYLGIPDEFIHKAPSDGLTGKTDEDNFGFTYEDLDTYILTGFCKSEELRERIEKRHNANLFKLNPMPVFIP